MTNHMPELKKEDEWIRHVNMAAFKKDMDDLGKRLKAEEGPRDRKHLQGVIDACDALLVIGFAGLGLSPAYVFPWVCLGIAITMRWCSVAHHVSHGGYHRCAEQAYTRGKFGAGLMGRMRDWLDWMLPEAWDVEHNTLHHYCTNELDDPDFVQRNTAPVREMKSSLWVKSATIAVLVLTWKWMYYATNTWKHYLLETRRRKGGKTPEKVLERAEHPLMLYQIFWGPEEMALAQPLRMFFSVFAPYVFFRMVLPPIVFYYLMGAEAGSNAIYNILLTELWANVHSFFIIVPNHCGDDMYHFDSHVVPFTATFYLRQIISSADYCTGSDPTRPNWVNELIDGSQGWLNYQIEHHCFPNVSMVSCRKAQPEIKKICKHHGIPYVQHPIWTRIAKTFDVMTGVTSCRPFPKDYEVKSDLGERICAHR